MKKLWEELTILSAKSICSCTCTCGAKDTMHKAEQDKQLIQFLMDLNEVYTIIRGSMLMMNQLPFMGQVFAFLVQEEKQREFKPNNHSFAESSSSLNVSSSSSRCSGGPSSVKSFQTNTVIIVRGLDIQRTSATKSMGILVSQMLIQDLITSLTITIHQEISTTRTKTLIPPILSIKGIKVRVLQQIFMKIC